MKYAFVNKSGYIKDKGVKIKRGPWAVCNGSGIVAVAASYRDAASIMESIPCSYIAPFHINR